MENKVESYYSNKFGEWNLGVYYPSTVCGFFSVLSTTLYDLSNTRGVIRGINTEKGLTLYKNDPYQNVWRYFFKEAKPHINGYRIPEFSTAHLVNDSLYLKRANLNLYAPFIKKYFLFSDLVNYRVDALVKKYSINYDNTIAVHYRGTDKYMEVPIQPIEKFIDHVSELLNNNNQLKVLLQSDEQNILKKLSSAFPNISFFFDELPMSETGGSLHMGYGGVCFDKFEYGINYLASIGIISRCKHIVTHVGNGAFWTALFRGSIENFSQIAND